MTQDHPSQPNAPTTNAVEPLDLDQLNSSSEPCVSKNQVADTASTTRGLAPVPSPEQVLAQTEAGATSDGKGGTTFFGRRWVKVLLLNVVSLAVLATVFWFRYVQTDAATENSGQQQKSQDAAFDPPLPMAQSNSDWPGTFGDPIRADSPTKSSEATEERGASSTATPNKAIATASPTREQPKAIATKSTPVVVKKGEPPALDRALFSNLEPTEVDNPVTFHVGDTARAHCLSHDGRRLATGHADGTVQLWETTSGKSIATIDSTESSATISALAFSPDGSQLLSGTAGGSISLHTVDGTSAALTFTVHQSAISGLAFLNEIQQVVSIDQQGLLHLWDLSMKAPRLTIETSLRASRLAVAADGLTALVGGWDGRLAVCRLDDGQLIHSWSGHEDIVNGSAVAADGLTGISTDWNGNVLFWNLETGERQRTFDGKVSEHALLAVSTNGDQLAIANTGDSIQVWDLNSSLITHRLLREKSTSSAADRPTVLQFSHDGQAAMSVTTNGTVRIWKISGTEVQENG